MTARSTDRVKDGRPTTTPERRGRLARSLPLLALAASTLAACSRDTGPSSAAPARTTHGVTPPRPVPPGPYVVRYDCFHSEQPFGSRTHLRNASWDLGAQTLTRVVYTSSSEPAPATSAELAKRQPVISPLAPDKAAKIEAATLAVLRGGPFKPEIPVHEGTPCTLAISAGGVEVFTLPKAKTDEKDAATTLVQTLGG